jgi:hypothetical protein
MERTDQQPQQPSPRTVAETLGAQIRTHAAEHLDTIPPLTHPVTGDTLPARCMTGGYRVLAMRRATDAVLDRVPSKWVRTHARAVALAALPPISGSTTDYAAALREIAEVAA